MPRPVPPHRGRFKLDHDNIHYHAPAVDDQDKGGSLHSPRLDANPAKDVGNTIHGLYPSLLDPNSPSLNYDTIVGDTAYVYWVQGRNKTAVGAPDMARDLWRQKVRITWG